MRQRVHFIGGGTGAFDLHHAEAAAHGFGIDHPVIERAIEMVSVQFRDRGGHILAHPRARAHPDQNGEGAFADALGKVDDIMGGPDIGLTGRDRDQNQI